MSGELFSHPCPGPNGPGTTPAGASDEPSDDASAQAAPTNTARGSSRRHSGRNPGQATKQNRKGLPPERSFYCQVCQTTVRGHWVSAGWYALERATGASARHLRLGLYCLTEATRTNLADWENQHAERLGLPNRTEAERGTTRLLDRARVMLDDDARIRAAEDALGVPTQTLKHWLAQTGYEPHPALDSKSPIAAINELSQTGRLTRVSYDVATDGPAHARIFTCTVTAHRNAAGGAEGQVPGNGTGGGKQAARTNAAADLLAHLDETHPRGR